MMDASYNFTYEFTPTVGVQVLVQVLALLIHVHGHRPPLFDPAGHNNLKDPRTSHDVSVSSWGRVVSVSSWGRVGLGLCRPCRVGVGWSWGLRVELRSGWVGSLSVGLAVWVGIFQPQRSPGIFQTPPIDGISQPHILSQQGPSIFKLVDEVMRGGAQGGCAFATSRQRSTLEASEPPALAKMMPSAFFNSHWAANAIENQKKKWSQDHFLGPSGSPPTPRRPLATRSPITTRSFHAYLLKEMAHAKTATFCSERSGDAPVANLSGFKCILQFVT